ncbi:hypothetical protein DM47_2835 [Burkholderia mallei]|nr:hypothetical protein DM75_3601 [Burkholderia mallei]KGD11033.1 hypothetical protein DO63_5927 [Burkholderia pseudomallei]KGW80399.1 hypothetical protein Y046_6363 [Burkholderia pseudomallei MSHR2990]KGW98563.1 hypothetical protein Y048_6361 [Burkholderia pseudomallei MSHR456]KGX95598.1 hypothetical protein X997_5432 [Burkholderia pseudomallei A79C]
MRAWPAWRELQGSRSANASGGGRHDWTSASFCSSSATRFSSSSSRARVRASTCACVSNSSRVTRSSFEKPCVSIAFTLRSTSLAGEFFSRSPMRACRSLKTSLGCFMVFPFQVHKICAIAVAIVPANRA